VALVAGPLDEGVGGVGVVVDGARVEAGDFVISEGDSVSELFFFRESGQPVGNLFHRSEFGFIRKEKEWQPITHMSRHGPNPLRDSLNLDEAVFMLSLPLLEMFDKVFDLCFLYPGAKDGQQPLAHLLERLDGVQIDLDDRSQPAGPVAEELQVTHVGFDGFGRVDFGELRGVYFGEDDVVILRSGKSVADEQRKQNHRA
jgi:hypothetical protein